VLFLKQNIYHFILKTTEKETWLLNILFQSIIIHFLKILLFQSIIIHFLKILCIEYLARHIQLKKQHWLMQLPTSTTTLTYFDKTRTPLLRNKYHFTIFMGIWIPVDRVIKFHKAWEMYDLRISKQINYYGAKSFIAFDWRSQNQLLFGIGHKL
jgi:hypothetical protein